MVKESRKNVKPKTKPDKKAVADIHVSDCVKHLGDVYKVRSLKVNNRGDILAVILDKE